MSDKKYPTRMHEILTKLGEPPLKSGEMFALNTDPDDIDYYLTDGGDMFLRYGTANKTVRMAHVDEVIDAIIHGITRRPRLTEEQVKRLRALIALEAMYLAKNKDGSVGAFTNKPTKNALYWNTNDSYVFYLSIVGTCLSELVSWEDPEPLDIVQTLRDAGVEVEG